MDRHRLYYVTKIRPLTALVSNWLSLLSRWMATPMARRLVLGLFIVQAIILVFVTRIGVPPDETNHINFIEYYAQHSLSPIFTDQKPTYSLGDKTREVDYLYHYSMSLLYRVLPISTAAKYIVIRLFSMGIGLTSLIILAKIGKRLGMSAATITVTLLILANLPMVLMMSSAINNDAAVWLGMMLGIWLLLRLWEKPTLVDLSLLASISLSGGLVKRTLLPIGLIFGVLALFIAVRNFKVLHLQLRRFDWRIGLATVLMLTSLGLFSERALGNFVRYHSFAPACEQVQDPADCSVFWVNVRMAGLAKQHAAATSLFPLPVFAPIWLITSFYNVIDIQTQFWLHQVKPADWLTPLLVLMLSVGIGYGIYYELRGRRYRSEQRSRWRLGVLGIALAFVAMHLAYNYYDYLTNRVFGLGLNGRYIIPSILPLVALVSFYWTRLLTAHPRWQVVVASIAVLGTIAGSGLIMMLRNPQLYFG